MPIDPSIIGGLRQQPFNNPFQALIAMREGEQQRAAQQREDEQRAARLHMEQQRLDQDERQIATAEKKAFSAEQVKEAAEKAYLSIKNGNADEVLSLLPPESRMLAEGWLGEITKAKQERDAVGIALGKRTAQFIQANNYDPVTSATSLRLLSDVHPGAKDALEHVSDPVAFKKLIDHFATMGDKPSEPYTLGEGGKRFGSDNQLVAENQKAPEAPREPGSIDAAITAARNNPLELNRLLKIKGQMEAAGRAPTTDAQEPLVAVMGQDGRPVLMRRSQAEGKAPANTREQGRPVTSGDAGRIAELDTSLNDLDALTANIGKTGAGSYIGAKWVPNVVSEYTGLGTESKSRQGLIDRVKQVIGKALEGGVLRKEDEAKYERILPTIGDPPDVAAAKLDGLKKALVLRRQTTIEALKDANYDVANFEKRTESKPKSGAIKILKIEQVP